MTADHRVALGPRVPRRARKRKVATLQPSLLIRECAELRRLLGQVLDVIEGQTAVLDADQAAIVLSALEDASDGIRERAAHCPDCAASPADLCDGCADRLSRAEGYDDLTAKLREANPMTRWRSRRKHPAAVILLGARAPGARPRAGRRRGQARPAVRPGRPPTGARRPTGPRCPGRQGGRSHASGRPQYGPLGPYGEFPAFPTDMIGNSRAREAFLLVTALCSIGIRPG